MAKPLLLLAFVVAILAKKYNTKAGPVQDKLNVHLIAHTHDDVGWLKTVDQYYYGANDSIQHAGVQYVIDTVVQSLQQNPDRKFSYVEQAFFQRWWREQDSEIQDQVQGLVASGQLVFINGGWCMHDEAAAHYIAMVDQTTLGHRFLKEQFNAVPKIGWQIDPFGHSATQAALLSAEVGFEGLYFARIDYQDKATRMINRSLEMIWRASKSLGSSAQVFTGEFAVGYGPPDGFNYDVFSNDQPINDNPNLEDYNVKERVDAFVDVSKATAQVIRGNNIMFTMGSDFEYNNAHHWFKNLDKLIHHVNADGRINVFYSTPEIYTAEKQKESIEWPLKDDDFFPYADGPHQFWTGYFTSRPALKRYVRTTSQYYQAVRQVSAIAKTPSSSLETLAEALGVAQHHDGVSGTAKQHTTFDYAMRLARGVNQGDNVFSTSIAALTQGGVNSVTCHLLNQSSCPITQTLGNGKGVTVVLVVWNPLGRSQEQLIRLPVAGPNVVVTNTSGGDISSQVYATGPSYTNYGQNDAAGPYTLAFYANANALGWNTFILKDGQRSIADETKEAAADVLLENAAIQVTVCGTTGLLCKITNKKSGVSSDVSQEWRWYESNKGDAASGQASGAYIFRPVGNTSNPVSTSPPTNTVINGAVVQEVRQVISPWISQTLRLPAKADYLEVEYTVGPIPVDDNIGKEIVTLFTTPLKTFGYAYTDSNGREMQERLRNFRKYWNLDQTEPVAGNYYPINSAAFIKDTTAQLTVLTDASIGGGSIHDGQLELMVHRRVLHDDHRGVGEPLSESEFVTPYSNPCDPRGCGAHYGPGLIIRGRFRVLLDAPATASRTWRVRQDEFFSELVPLFPDGLPKVTMDNALNNVPENVQVMTIERLSNTQVLLRLAHQFAVDEALNQPVTLALDTLFNPRLLNVQYAEEVSLTANQVKAAQKKPHAWRVEGEPYGPPVSKREAPLNWALGTNVTLNPMEIRTFLLTVAP
eukprot:TRINITY_DN4250_c0_g1_i1.p1 TRINITY_DN4250_c0_g1~~TRINITY_DN4250_c0_g1_i1.p1  ORF type:complete len:989 (-),score=171.07 TRINITY_DN4250_c0_g1_i1:1004-3946(-)